MKFSRVSQLLATLLFLFLCNVYGEFIYENFETYQGTGFANGGGGGKINTNLWRMAAVGYTGSTPVLTNDYTQGNVSYTASARGAGAIFSPTLKTVAFGFVPAPSGTLTSSFMNPDSFERRIMNTYGVNINQVNVTYIQWEYNKADASTIFGFDITANGVKSSGGLYQTGEITNNQFKTTPMSYTFNNINWNAGTYLYLTWTSNDYGNPSGSARDVIAIDDLYVYFNTAPTTTGPASTTGPATTTAASATTGAGSATTGPATTTGAGSTTTGPVTSTGAESAATTGAAATGTTGAGTTTENGGTTTTGGSTTSVPVTTTGSTSNSVPGTTGTTGPLVTTTEAPASSTGAPPSTTGATPSSTTENVPASSTGSTSATDSTTEAGTPPTGSTTGVISNSTGGGIPTTGSGTTGSSSNNGDQIQVVDSDSSNIPLIAGVVSGGFVLLVLLIIFFIFFIKKRKRGTMVELFTGDTHKTSKVLAKLKQTGIRKITDVEIKEKLGDGNFGQVFRGIWQGTVEVALKKIKNDEDLEEFLNEAAMLQVLSHPHVVSFFGVFTDDQGYKYMVTEYMNQGSLQQLIQRQKTNLSIIELLGMARHAAAGMKYLEEQKIIHRDLALRNILTSTTGSDGKYLSKVADFGLARSIEQGVYKSNTKMLPVRWTSPECIQYGKYDAKSDIWAFGVLLWELFSYGKMPYGIMSNEEVAEKVTNGYRLPAPEDCPTPIAELMGKCWEADPEMRPAFSQIFTKIDKVYREYMASNNKTVDDIQIAEPPPEYEEDPDRALLYANKPLLYNNV